MRYSRSSLIPFLHLFLVSGPPVTAGSLSRPPDHLDAPLRLTPSLACPNTMLCFPAQWGGVLRGSQKRAGGRRMRAS
jgi:hypothetical protein